MVQKGVDLHMILDKDCDVINVEVLMRIIQGKKIIIFGASPKNKRIYKAIDKARIFCIYDNNPQKWGTKFDGILVTEPKAGDADIVILSALSDYGNLRPQLSSLTKQFYFFLDDIYFKECKGYFEYFVQTKRLPYKAPFKSFKYIHIIPDEKFLACLFEAIEYASNMDEHYFLIYCVGKDDLYNCWDKCRELHQKFHNVFILDDCHNWNGICWKEHLICLDELFANCKKIIFHGGEWIGDELLNYFVQKKRFVREKGIWVVWTGKIKQVPACQRRIKQLLCFVRVILSDDITYEMLNQDFELLPHFRLKNKLSYSRSMGLPEKRKGNGRCNIFIGHSCFEYNYNEETIELLNLSGFEDKADIYCITSYGDQETIDKVKASGTQSFGEHFHLIENYLPYEDYIKLLNNMDVAVLGMNVNCGYTTRRILMWLGVKQYLKKDSDVYNASIAEGACVYDYYTIPMESLESFMNYPKKDQQINYELAKEDYDIDCIAQRWQELFELDMDQITLSKVDNK